MSNRSGQAYAFMSMTPILPGKADEVDRAISSWPSGADSPMARMGKTHFARFLVVRDFIYQGEPQIKESLHSEYVIFVSNFDGDLEPYLNAMLDLMPTECEQAWSQCVACPPISEREDFIAYLLHNQIDTTFFASAYPEATVTDVHESVELRSRVIESVVSGQALPPAELMARWRADFGEVRA